MTKKQYIVFSLFGIAVCYIISPWFFEKKLFVNEFLSAAGFGILLYKRVRTGNDLISICIVALLAWCGVHMLSSLWRMDRIYYYLRNLVIVYSVFSFFIGYYCLHYLPLFIRKFRVIISLYISFFLFFPISKFLFERFGVAALFPVLFKNPVHRYALPLLVLINIIYSFTYNSSTALLLAAFYLLIWLSPGYKFFIRALILLFIAFTIFFISIEPNLSIIKKNYTPTSDRAIHEVMDSNPLLGIDGNSTWRLVLWKQVIVDHFPANLFGLGFGTPVFKYFPVEDFAKLDSLPYVVGAHNSYIYLFGRLGIVYLLLAAIIYMHIFKEYYNYQTYYRSNESILLFWSFFAVSIIALFNPVLESPIYSSAYWMIFGFLAKAIYNRTHLTEKITAA